MDEGWATPDEDDRSPVVLYVHVGLALGAAVAWELWSPWSFFDFIVSSRYGVVLWIVALVAAVVFIYRLAVLDQGYMIVWAVAAAFVLVWTGRTAILDADDYRNHNCWIVRGSETADGSSVWECAPGDQEPYQWSGENEDGGSYRFCEYLDEVDVEIAPTRGSYWTCEQAEF